MKEVLNIIAILIISCTVIQKNDTEQTKHEIKQDSAKIQAESFDWFCEQFYSDTAFQMRRINFPLEGEIKYWADDNDTVMISEKWKKEEITQISGKETLLEHYPNLQSRMTRNDTMVVEIYWIENSGFAIGRRYKLIDRKWFLTYYDLFNL